MTGFIFLGELLLLLPNTSDTPAWSAASRLDAVVSQSKLVTSLVLLQVRRSHKMVTCYRYRSTANVVSAVTVLVGEGSSVVIIGLLV